MPRLLPTAVPPLYLALLLGAVLQCAGKCMGSAEPTGGMLRLMILRNKLKAVQGLLKTAKGDPRRDVNRVHPTDGDTPLVNAAQMGELPIVEALIAAGADPNIAMFSGQTALMIAASKGNDDITKALLGANASAAMTDQHGMSALWKVAEAGPDELVAWVAWVAWVGWAACVWGRARSDG